MLGDVMNVPPAEVARLLDHRQPEHGESRLSVTLSVTTLALLHHLGGMAGISLTAYDYCMKRLSGTMGLAHLLKTNCTKQCTSMHDNGATHYYDIWVKDCHD